MRADKVLDRWQLNRAGIVNVYQYENEVLHFGGGRLLLRGVNGSGKTTAMNMLLPFLLTAHLRRIDAAGEQSGILKSWMLDGRDDAQPVGYLWIEFERQGEFFVCGCGIKANRSSNEVRTWWFITSQRPGIDFQLVENRNPLSREGLRAALGGDEVFDHNDRQQYRRRIELHLFNGTPIDQHIKLINMVRNPRVGDRIDVDLPTYLVEALPQLSEQALAEAAQPLDDLEEHRRSVTEMSRTLEAVHGMLDVYRAYCSTDLRQRVDEGRDRLTTRHNCAREEKRKQQQAEAVATEVKLQEDQLRGLEERTIHLRSEIAALKESPEYKRGQQLVDLRNLVEDLIRQRSEADARVASRVRQVESAADDVRQEYSSSRDNLEALNQGLANASRLGSVRRVSQRPPGPFGLNESAFADTDIYEPRPLKITAIDHQIGATAGAVGQRRLDVEEAETALTEMEAAETWLKRAEAEAEDAAAAAQAASNRLADHERCLAQASRNWSEQTRIWASHTYPLMQTAGIEAPTLFSAPEREPTVGEPSVEISLEAKHTSLLSVADALVSHWQRAVAETNYQLDSELVAEKEAKALVDELIQRREPDPPWLSWQSTGEYCLADLIDFAPDLDAAERAALEAALESSGLLSARLADDAAFELASGDLVARVSEGVSSPLSEYLTVTVPNQLLGVVDEGSVTKLLESISYDLSSRAATAASTDGSFRVGALSGRHSKDQAEFIGATARRTALERTRQEAANRLREAQAATTRRRKQLSDCQSALHHALNRRSLLPALGEVIEMRAHVGATAQVVEDAVAKRDAATASLSDAEQLMSKATDALHSKANTLALPPNRIGLAEARRELDEMALTLDNCRTQLKALGQSVRNWRRAVERWREAVQYHDGERSGLNRIKSKQAAEQVRLKTLEDSIGAEYTKIAAACLRSETELDGIEENLPRIRTDKEGKIRLEAEARTDVRNAAEKCTRAENSCETARLSLAKVLETPGYLSAICGPGQDLEVVPTIQSVGFEGLKGLIETIDQLLASVSTPPETAAQTNSGVSTAGTGVRADFGPDSVRQSLRQRRDALGEGWDAQDRHPDLSGPLIVEVYGPSGRAPLAESVQAVSQKHQELTGLLTGKQNTALRELLQGMIALEIAEKVSNASGLVERMNRHLGTVTTAHDVGVKLRWRRSPELDQDTARLVDLLSMTPDLRTDDQEQELRLALSRRLDEARAEQPDAAYRQLIAETLDYKRWHELAVIVRRAGMEDRKLSRNTPLSEGEKKLVTYLPLFAAVAASCDALADQGSVPGMGAKDVSRFVLLDDAFAKVSEDNHASLFGLLVDLDLDFVATSERLWGTHSTVPDLSITEVIRDAKRESILLEHYQWNGTALTRKGP